MSVLAAVIADDEPLLRLELRDALTDLWPELHVVGEVGDGAAALLAIEAHRPAVSFLDVRMPKLTGLEVAERVQGMTQMVFVTAYDSHAIAAFEHGAVDYVLKPIRRPRLAATIQRLKDRLAVALANREPNRPCLQWLQATTGKTLRFIAVQDVCFVKSDGKYTQVVTATGEALIRRPLSALLANLDQAAFWQINRGIVVNVRHIDRVVRGDDGDMFVYMREHGIGLPVSKPHQPRFRGM